MKLLSTTAILAITAMLSTVAYAQAPAKPEGAPSHANANEQNKTSTTETETAQSEGQEVPEIVVTGVLTARAPTSVAVSTLTANAIEKTVPVSAADLLRNVPGVYVNSALGEIRNVVYSRGISANSNDAAAGYYYVSLQEDGLPVTNVTFNNYGPDYYYREDLTLARLEALRGGSAVVTGPNAPGGIFNYISKTGRSAPGTEVRARVGLEGNGRNPYYRFDAISGGQFAQSDLYYSVGGFYRHDVGARDAGYAMNRGGQIKANLLWDYGDGSVMFYGKYLDDHNAVNTFLPAADYGDPKVASGLSWYDTIAIPAVPHNFVTSLGAQTERWDGSDLIHSVAYDIGLKNEHHFGDGWTFSNNLKLSHNKSDWNTSALAFAVPITDSFTNVILDASQPGTYSYYNHNSGQLVAQVQNAAGVRTVLLNNLPNQQALANGVITQVAFNFHPSVYEIMDQASLSKKFDRGSFTLGGYFAYSHIKQLGGGAGFGLSTIENQPAMLDITLTTPSGETKQLTNSMGLSGIGQRFGGTPSEGRQLQASIFAGGDYDLTEKLKAEGAVRYDFIRVKGYNDVAVANPNSSNPNYGGLDGDPSTLYDNYAVTYTKPYDYRFSLDYVSFTGALTYQFDRDSGIYVRFSQGEKAPDFTFFQTYTSLTQLALQVPIPQKVQQIEGGYKYSGRTMRLSVIPFFSRLSNVGTQEFGTNADGSSYSPPVLLSTTKTYGIEFEGDVDFLEKFNFRTALTLQKSKSEGFATYNFGAPGPADDAVVKVPDGDADNTPKIMASTTLTYQPIDTVEAGLTWRYMGSRPANRYNAFDLPAYSEFNLNVNWRPTEKLTVNATVNNLFNQFGVLGFAPAGSLLSALNRQNLTPAQVAANPNQIFSILPNQPRSMFLTVGYKF